MYVQVISKADLELGLVLVRPAEMSVIVLGQPMGGAMRL